MKKRIFVTMLILLMIFQFCTKSYASNAVSPDLTVDGEQGMYSQESFNELIDTGKPSYTEDSEYISPETPLSFIASVLAFILSSIPASVNALLSIAVMSDTPTYEYKFFTIESLLKGEFSLFDANIFDTSYRDSAINQIIKENVAKWFFALRNFAIVALLAVLVYIGLLMAISETASDKSKYKKMLASWFASFVLIFVIQYILAIAVNVSTTLTNIVSTVSENIENATQTENTNTQEDQIERQVVHGYINEKNEFVPGLLSSISTNNGWNRLGQLVVYSALVYYQVKFFFMYLKRFFMIGFLTAISPLITITYSIDKAGDNQAQAYKTWFREIMIAIFIQPIHLLFFLIFVQATQAIILTAPIFAILLIGTLARAESMIRKLFKIDGAGSLGSLKGGGKK